MLPIDFQNISSLNIASKFCKPIKVGIVLKSQYEKHKYIENTNGKATNNKNPNNCGPTNMYPNRTTKKCECQNGQNDLERHIFDPYEEAVSKTDSDRQEKQRHRGT